MYLKDYVSIPRLAAEIAGGWITRKTHPYLPLSIYTYTHKCQFDQHWTTETIRCRGLIVEDLTGRIVAMPFPKIFATSMHGKYDFAPKLPDEPFEVYEKVDGSLAIIYHYRGKWHAASKGSFESDQARWAQDRLDARDTS